MKRRTFLTTVGGAAGAAALGGCSTAKGSGNGGKRPGTGRRATTTYGLGPVTGPKANSPFTLPVRQPGWFPDGADVNCQPKRLFLEEVAGITKRSMLQTFPVEFDYTGRSNKWILGSRIDATKTDDLTKFIQRLAVKVRQYNASLYRLRRLHLYWDYQDRPSQLVDPPKRNPHGDPKTEPKPKQDLPGFKQMVKDAETDWVKVTNQLNKLLETASSDGNNFRIKLLGADMIAANGYIVSMRVVSKKLQTDAAAPVERPAGAVAWAPPEVGGSSSHVSISSTFSSSSQG